ncbi:unnamed protein product [Lasius platythorax]|uniref:Uncharacterized protein n=1 Tax=Lasius platythorax TaxID=488582 RepID=A0AAV2NUI8_9HYME
MFESSNLNFNSFPLSKANEIQHLKLQTRMVEKQIEDLQKQYNRDLINFQNMIFKMHSMKQKLHSGNRLLKKLDCL